MTDSTDIEERTKRLLSALKKLGPGSHTRKEIAKQLGKPRLNVAETTLLDTLVVAGRIEKQPIKTSNPLVQRWEYRIIKETPVNEHPTE